MKITYNIQYTIYNESPCCIHRITFVYLIEQIALIRIYLVLRKPECLLKHLHR